MARNLYQYFGVDEPEYMKEYTKFEPESFVPTIDKPVDLQAPIPYPRGTLIGAIPEQPQAQPERIQPRQVRPEMVTGPEMETDIVQPQMLEERIVSGSPEVQREELSSLTGEPSGLMRKVGGLIPRRNINIPTPRTPEEQNAWSNIVQSWQRGDIGSAIDVLGAQSALGLVDWEQDVQPLITQYRQLELTDPVRAKNKFFNSLLGAIRMVPAMGKGALTGAAAGGAALLAGQAGPQVGLPEEIITVPTASSAGSMTYWALQGAGDVYNSLREAGVNHEISKYSSFAAGPIYAYIEKLQVDKIFPGAGKTIKRKAALALSKNIIKELTERGIDIGKIKAKDFATNVIQEGMQRAVTDTAQEAAKWADPNIKGNPLGDAAIEILKGSGEEMWEAAKTMPWLMGAGSSVKAIDTARQNRAAKKQAELAEQKAIEQAAQQQAVESLKPDKAQIVQEPTAELPTVTEEIKSEVQVDKEDKAGIPSEIEVREEPVTTEPIIEPSEEKIEPSRDVQEIEPVETIESEKEIKSEDLNIIRKELESAELGKKQKFGHKQMFPDFWQAGWKRKEIYNIIDKVEAGKSLTEKQQQIYDQLQTNYNKAANTQYGQYLRSEELKETINEIDQEQLDEMIQADALPVLLDYINADNPGDLYTMEELQREIEITKGIKSTAKKISREVEKDVAVETEKPIGLVSPKIGEVEAVQKAAETKQKEVAALQKEQARIDKKMQDAGPKAMLFPSEELTQEDQTIEMDFFKPADDNFRFRPKNKSSQGAVALAPVGGDFSEFKRAWSKYMTKEAGLPKEIYQSMEKKRGQIAYRIKEGEYRLKDLKDAMKEAGMKLNEVARYNLDKGLKNEIPISEFPKKIQEPLKAMRDYMDLLSLEMIKSGAVEGELHASLSGIGGISVDKKSLAQIIYDDLGTYVNRSYQIFEDPDWAKKVDPVVVNKARNFLREQFSKNGTELSEERLNGEINKLLARGENSPMSILAKGSKEGRKAVEILKKRKVIPQEIRDLWGEYKDIEVNYLKSITKMVNLTENQIFLNEIKEAGMGKIFFEEATEKNGISYHKPFSADSSKPYAPLNGMHTSQDIIDAFESLGSSPPDNMIFRWYLKVNGMAKANKTIFSLQTHARNFISNIGIVSSQGYWNIAKLNKGIHAFTQNRIKKSESEKREYVKRAIELGLIGNDVMSGELNDVMKDINQNGVFKFTNNKMAKSLNKTIGTVQHAYGAEDGFWKLFAWENEKDRYRKAYPDKSEAEIEEMTAEIIKNVMPTYSRIPKAIKSLRRMFIVGTFVSFPYEVARTNMHTIHQIKKELSNKKTHKIGAQRLAGYLGTIGAIWAGAALSRAILGITDDEEEAFRNALPPWSKNNPILFIGRDGNKLKYWDVGQVDPYAYLKKPVIRMLRGGDPYEAVMDSTKELFSPFMSEEMLLGKILDVNRNVVKGTTKHVYNSSDSFEKQTGDKLWHIYQAIEPGTLTSLRRLKKAFAEEPYNAYGGMYDKKNELLSTITGLRFSAIDPVNVLRFQTFRFNNELSQSKYKLNKENAKYRYNAMIKQYNKMYDDVIHAYKLGLSPKEIGYALKDSGLSGPDRKAVMSGSVTPRVKEIVARRLIKTNAK